MEPESLPRHIQEAIKRRDAVTRPVHDSLAALDLTWEIAGGNLAELEQALRIWEGKQWVEVHQGATAHKYHRYLLRLFHNFLSSAVAAVWHAERIVGRVKHLAPDLSNDFSRRLMALRASQYYCFLDRLRDYAIHAGHHVTVLVTRGATSEAGEETLVRSVCFDLKNIHLDIESELKRARSKSKRQDVQQLRELVTTLPEHVEMRAVVEEYFAEVGSLLRWLRKALLDFNTAIYARPFECWIMRRGDDSSSPD